MDDKTLTALKKSIEYWEAIERGDKGSRGARGCALCHLFNAPMHRDANCIDCPVFQKTGRVYCSGTPYIDYVKHHHREHGVQLGVLMIQCECCRKYAAQEVAFLKGLLPKEKTDA